MNATEPSVRQTDSGESKYSITLAIGLLAFTLFVIVSSEFMVMGLLPAMASDLNISLAKAGWFVTGFALAASLLGPALTILAGRYNSRNFLIISAIAFAAGNLVIALAPHYIWVITIRILQGGILPAAVSIVAVESVRLAGAENKGWAVSRVNLGTAATTILGIPAAVILADKLGWPASFAGFALLGLISAGLIYLWLPVVSQKTHSQSPMLSGIALLRRPHFLTHLLLSCILFAGMFVGYTYIAALLGTLASVEGAITAELLMAFGFAGVFGNWLSGRFVDRDPIAASAWVALALVFSMAVVAPAAKSLLCLTFAAGLWGTAHMAAFVICQIRIMKASEGAEAFALSLNISACNLGIGLGATLGGSIVTHHGVEAVGYGGAAVASIALLVSVMMIIARFLDRCGH